MLAYLAPILVFGLVIFVHELGHFLAAKATGVYAPRFSIGFGPAIFRIRRGETEYVLACLPLGGYVRMASRHDQESAFLEGGSEETSAKAETDDGYDPNAMIPFGPKPVPENRWFESKPLWARVVIMLAGVTMNTLLAVVVATGIFLNEGENVVRSTVVGAVTPVASLPALSALRAGDTIRAVNGKPVATWNAVLDGIEASSVEVRFTTQRGDVRVPLGGDPARNMAVARAVNLRLDPVLDSVVAGAPAATAGFAAGDSVVSIDGAPVAAWTDITSRVEASPGKEMVFVVARRNALDTLRVTPTATQQTDSLANVTRTVGKIGAASRVNSEHQSLPVTEALSLGLRFTKMSAGAVFKVLHDIGSGAQSVRQLGGPIAITRAAVDAGRRGFEDVLQLIVLLSINVAVLNLLPIPILDGGQIVINVLESIKGSPFTMRTREYILRFGLAMIAMLFVIVMYNDTREGFIKLFGWVGHLLGA